MKKFRVNKPIKSINEWTIEKRVFIFFWEFNGEIFSNNLHALRHCKELNKVN